jgi:hypothetical protein
MTRSPSSATVDWRRTQFQSARPLVNPQAAYLRDELAFVVVPGRPLIDLRNGNAPDMFFSAVTSAKDINFGTVSFGDPFLEAWERWSDHRTTFSMDYTAPQAGEPVTFIAQIQRVEALAPSMTITPRVTPPRAPKIDGADAFQSQSAVGGTPLVSWTAPSTGTATGYGVFVFELSRVGTASRFDVLAGIFTRSTSVRLPPGVLQPGRAYFIQVRAYVLPSANLEVGPFRHGLPAANADVLTAAFTTGGST